MNVLKSRTVQALIVTILAAIATQLGFDLNVLPASLTCVADATATCKPITLMDIFQGVSLAAAWYFRTRPKWTPPAPTVGPPVDPSHP